MQKQVIGIFFVLSIMLAVNASDYFPSKVGSAWEFDYKSFQGHSRGGTTDSGIVSWKICAIEQQGNAKKITIQERRELHRRTLFLVAYDNNYDSIFIPPRELTSDTVTFIDSENVLYGTISLITGQKTETLIHDPNGKIPSGIVVHNNSAMILGSIKPVIVVQNGSSCSKQCDNIGPVEFSDTVQIGLNGRESESWTLHSLPVSTKRELAQTRNVNPGYNRPQLTLMINELKNPISGNNLTYDLKGRIVPYISNSEKVSMCKGIFICIPDKSKK